MTTQRNFIKNVPVFYEKKQRCTLEASFNKKEPFTKFNLMYSFHRNIFNNVIKLDS